MPAGRGFVFLYQKLVADLTEDSRLKIDALLGDEEAQRTIDENRREAVVGSGWEVG